MAKPNISYRDVLADLRSRRARLDAAISAIVDILHESEGENESEQTPQFSFSNPPGAYANMTLVEASIHFLKGAGKPQKTADIAAALRRGGTSSKSKNLYRTLYNVLNNRLDKELTKDKGKWGLAEWHK
jgi:hypothetical protein